MRQADVVGGVPLRPAGPVVRGLFAALTKVAVPLVDRSRRQTGVRFEEWVGLRPHATSRRWGWVHYGIFLPSLPEPLRYLNTMTLIGLPGARIFDHDELVGHDARRLATLMTSTAAPGQHLIHGYDVLDDCSFADDGSTLRWGDELVVALAPGRATLTGRYGTFDVDLEIEITQQASWFIRTPFYRHLSLLSHVRGVVAGHPIDTLGTFEYARSVSPQSLRARPFPEGWKLPADFFTYQIVNIDPETQVLFAEVRAAGQVATRTGFLRTANGESRSFDDVTFEVLEYGEPLTGPQGTLMRMPLRQAITVRDRGVPVIRLEGTIDSDWRSGHGRGYVAAWTYAGEVRGRAVAGSGYIEWVDLT